MLQVLAILPPYPSPEKSNGMAYEKDCDIVNTLKGTEYIRALAEDGSTVRIPVEELGKVMAHVMPVMISSEKGLATADTSLLFRGTLSNANIITQGTYRCTKSCANIPNIENAGILVSIIAFEGPAYIVQLFFDLTSNNVFTRHKTDAMWFSWVKISATI